MNDELILIHQGTDTIVLENCVSIIPSIVIERPSLCNIVNEYQQETSTADEQETSTV